MVTGGEMLRSAARQLGIRRRGPARPGVKEVLIYNSMFGHRRDPSELEGMPDGYELTYDRSRFDHAVAVIFHTPSLGFIPLLRKRPGQIWVRHSQETEVIFTRQARESFTRRFDWSVNYRLDSEIVRTWIRPQDPEVMRIPPDPKTELVAAFISGRFDRCGRNEYVRELMRHIEVHSYGSKLNNRKLENDIGAPSKMHAIRRYHFTIAFENAIAPDYVTEKLFQPQAAGSVPVYMGAPNVADVAPAPDSFINVEDYPGPAELAADLKRLASDPEAYARLHEWRRRPFNPLFERLAEGERLHPWVRVCRRLAERERAGGPAAAG